MLAMSTVDPVQKQLIIAQCAAEKRFLSASFKNISDASQKLDLVFDFLGVMQSQLLEIDSKISALQNEVSELRAGVLRLTGEPVLDVISKWSKATVLAATSHLQDAEYVEQKVCGPGHLLAFALNHNNDFRRIMNRMNRFQGDPRF